MARYIDADLIIKNIANIEDLRTLNTKTIGEAIRSTPTADVAEVKHGKWVETILHNGCTPDYDCACSICGKSGLPYSNFCPNCGAKMDG